MITFDFEAKSHCDLTKYGSWVYSEHPTTEIICAAYGIDDEPIQTWWPGKEPEGSQCWGCDKTKGPQTEGLYGSMPCDLYVALMAGHTIEAHNVAFERGMWHNICVPEFGWMLPYDHAWRDTQAVAAYYAMPPALGKLANALGYEGKNKKGGALITKYSKLHNPTAKALYDKRTDAGLSHIPDHEWIDWGDMTKTEKDKNPEAKEEGGYYNEDFADFVQYCKDDVILEQTISDVLGDLPDKELRVFQLDQEINLRGIPLDKKSIQDATSIVEKRAEELEGEFRELTNLKPSQTTKVKDWFEKEGAFLDNLQADYLEDYLKEMEHHEFDASGMSDFSKIKRALTLRVRYNKASTKKLSAMMRQRGHDGKARYQTKYHGAVTGRGTGAGFQPLNLSKGFEDLPPQQLINDISHRSPEWLDIMYGNAMDAVGKASRHHIKAEEGKKLIAGDFVSIEAVLLACVAGEQWKIEAFERGDPIYELMGCKIHNLGDDAIALALEDKKKFKKKYPAERFDGKTGELAFGYQGGLGAWRNFDSSDTHSDDRVNEIKDAWREEHPATKQLWYDMDEASIEAVAYPGRVTEVGPLSFEIVDEWLSMRLPNDKRIWYRDPQLKKAMPPWHKPEAFDVDDEDTWEYEDCWAGTCDCRPRRQLSYMSQKEGQWKRVSTYGGKITENAIQATSREVLIPAMMNLRDEGYKIILTVYDEIICEMPHNEGSAEELVEIMSECPGDWAKGWPISVDAWSGERYKK